MCSHSLGGRLSERLCGRASRRDHGNEVNHVGEDAGGADGNVADRVEDIVRTY